jgi:hypothetical protein
MTTKPSPTHTARASQGSQPHFAGLRVGIMRVGEHQGLRKARLWINGSDTHLRVDLAEGASQHLAGHGTLTLDAVHLPAPGRRGEVTLTFLADDA